MGRAPCCDRTKGLKKGPWTPEEDKLLVDYIQTNGHGSWRLLPKLAGQIRTIPLFLLPFLLRGFHPHAVVLLVLQLPPCRPQPYGYGCDASRSDILQAHARSHLTPFAAHLQG
jgi:hypothetical protein